MYISCKEPHWVGMVSDSVQATGYACVHSAFAGQELELIRAAMYDAQVRIQAEVGLDKLQAAGEFGVLRCMMKFNPLFMGVLSHPMLTAVVDALLGNTAILHLQNGFILPSFPAHEMPSHFQSRYHRDFPRYLNGYLASVNILLAVDAFDSENGATRLVPGSHQKPVAPTEEYMAQSGVSVLCPAGSLIVFDSTLWHASGLNTSGKDRLAINHQYTRSFIKPQMDYVRVLGEGAIAAQPERVQQLLGYYSRPPASLEEYYRPESERVYRKGQG